MDKLKQDLEKELTSLLNKMPEKNNKSLIGKQKRLKFFIDNQEEFAKRLEYIGKSYAELNKLNDKSLIDLKDLLKSYYKSLYTSI